ncbi:AAA family ATPase [Geobacillus subterraneus]|uniref:AAA family ATPase n=2 Tax=Geobacillus TaxID=129337 RepID=A0ABN4NJB4_9BACL|nr:MULTISPECIES: sigma 54-interacting transcriptional regulator [Geobacillus]AMX84789.1 AAA family ATPase [Geobacillus subterraneus]KZS25402.1 sigma-54-dependent Fis family transcriptional regulator [Geobacillus subterraneus]OXB85613.1 sigma-54-dependent Fis family transcriptional regulator [Geobacillus uzenensis]QIZ66384.1 sigma 54-interacting transcriptional regulator [Geobacillus subterraneus]WPZ18591.1 sigma 54-interacting transcriptional regulator [Geobacillus subterraneus]
MNRDVEALLSIYEQIIEMIDLGIHAVDKQGKTIIYNRKMRDIEGMDIEDVLDKNILDVFRFDPKQPSTLLQTLQTGESTVNQQQTYFNNKGQAVTTINQTHPLRKDGNIIGAVEIAKDVTKFRKLLQEQRHRGETAHTFTHIVGHSASMQTAIRLAKHAARSDAPVFLIGEKGTGKELFATGIHHDSGRRAKPFLAQTCLALPDEWMEVTLFGNEEQGDIQPGLFEQADGGTVLLNDIDALSLPLQKKLYRFLQDKQFFRVHGRDPVQADVRLIASTSGDPIDAVQAGQLFKPLYYQLAVHCIVLPPLRERKEDILPLAAHFIGQGNERYGLNVQQLDDDVEEAFLAYDWPGNVRELETVINETLEMMDGGETITFDHLPASFRTKLTPDAPRTDFLFDTEDILPLEKYMEEVEIYYIRKALQHHGFNITKTAKALGLSRQNLQYRIRKYRIDKEWS